MPDARLAVVPAAARMLVLGTCAMLAACGPSDRSEVVGIAFVGAANALFAQGRDLSYAGQAVRSASAEGLVAFDAQGRVVPALADRWIVLDDGQTYIFRLRDGTWKGGEPLTAASARIALRSAISGLKGTSLALDLGTIETIRAMAGRVIEVRLRRPMPDLLQLLAQPELGLVRRGAPAGPMDMVRAGETATLIPIDPDTLGLPEIADWRARTRRLKLVAMPADQGVRLFKDGGADLLLGGSLIDFPLTGEDGIARGSIQMDPVMGLFGLVALNDKGLLASAATREALAMAIDREALANDLGGNVWTGMTRIVPAGVTDDPGTSGERWRDMPLDQRRDRARTAIAAAREEAATPDAAPAVPADAAPTLRIVLPRGPGAMLLLRRLREDFAAIGVRTRAVADPAEADIALVDVVARVPRTSWFLNALHCGVRRGLCDPSADALMDQVRLSADPATAERLQAEALASLTASNVYIPLGQPLRWSLVRRGLTGFATNPTGLHPLMPLALKPT